MRSLLAEKSERWNQQLKEEGRQEGRQEGRKEGEAVLLVRQLQRRFGALPDWARERIATATSDALEEWGLRVLDAESLEDVLH